MLINREEYKSKLTLVEPEITFCLNIKVNGFCDHQGVLHHQGVYNLRSSSAGSMGGLTDALLVASNKNQNH